MLAEMLHCSFSPVEDVFFFCLFVLFFQKLKVAQLFSTVDSTELVFIQDGEY